MDGEVACVEDKGVLSSLCVTISGILLWGGLMPCALIMCCG